MNNITVAHGHSSIEVLHSLTPLILASKKLTNCKWNFINYKFKNLFKQQGDLLILLRKYHDGRTNNDTMIKELLELKKNFSKIVYFDDSASATSIFFCIFPYVDNYWKRSHLEDLDLYKKKFYGGHLYSDFYHKKYNVSDHNQEYYNPVLENFTELNKLKISWNIGIGIFPLNKSHPIDYMYNNFRRLLASLSIFSNVDPLYFFFKYQFKRMQDELGKEKNLYSKKNFFSSRFKSNIYRPSIGYQRKLFMKKFNDNPFFLTKEISKRKFTEESHSIFGIVSPYGWGEICYRDFEAALGGALLIKPDMSHIKTWPNIYSNNMYYSLDWDLSNASLLEKIFDNKIKYENYVYNSRQEYLISLSSCVSRCITMIQKLF